MQTTYETLPQGRKRLVRLMQDINYGRIEHLHVRAGEPTFDPPPPVVREVKFGADNGHHVATSDFALKTQVVELLREFDRLGTGVIDAIEVKAGLPFRMLVRG